MAEYRRSEIVSGLFILAAVAVFSLFAFKVGDVDPLAWAKPSPLTCTAHFADVKTLEEGAKVTVAGKPVGKVEKLELVAREVGETDRLLARQIHGTGPRVPAVSEHWLVVKVSFAIEDHSLLLDPASARVRLAQDGFLGLHFLDLFPGHWAAGAEVKRAGDLTGPIEVPAEGLSGLDAMLSRFNALADEVQELLALVRRDILSEHNVSALQEMMADLKQTVRSAKESMRTIEDFLVDRPDNERGLYAMLLDPASTLLKGADRRLNELADHVLEETLRRRLDPLISQGGDVLTKAQSAVNELETAIRQVQGMIEEGNPEVQRILKDLAATTGRLDGRIDSLQANVEGLLRRADGMLAENAPQIAESLRRLQRTMWHFEMAIRKVRANPSYLIFGDDERLLDPREVDESALRASGRARPYGQRDESDEGGR